MASSGGIPGGGAPNGPAPAWRPDSDLSYVPVGWLIFVMAWSIYGLVSAWWLFGNSGLPDKVFYFFFGGLVANVITILWGIYLLGLAFGRSGRFPRHFTIWQIALIVWVLARQAYVLAVPDFTFSARGLTIAAIEIAIGLLCIYLLRRDSGAQTVHAKPQTTVHAKPQTEAPPVFVSVVAALLGIILGAVIGALVGFFAGSVIADITEVSCFEGGCGYFAAFFGLAGLVVGAIGGGILAVWLVHRRRRKPAA